MRIDKVRIKNYRSIKSETIVDFEKYLTILGPNNSGKTNFLKAIFLFFEAFRNNTYSIKNDLPFGISGGQTSIAISFLCHPKNDSLILQKYAAITDLFEGEKEINNGYLTLYLNFSNIGNPSYRFFTNDKVKEASRELYRKLQDELIHEFLEKFTCKYVPSEKSAAKLYEDFLLPHLREYIGTILKDQNEKVARALSSVSLAIADGLSKAGLNDIKCEFELPEQSFKRALSKFDFFIDDGEKTLFHRKGSGIQATMTLACFKWISEREMQDGKNVIWLIEEPESYLHPGMTDSCRKIISDLSDASDVFATTHSIGFIPMNPEKVLQTHHLKQSGTTFSKFKGYAEATNSIRNALGIRFSDYYSLSEFNIFVEGKTDKYIIENALSLIKQKGTSNKFEFLRKASIMDFTGTSSLKDFLKSTYAFMAKERAIAVIFDGDDAGQKASRDLVNYFSNKETDFKSNQEFILLPGKFPIEALFPEAWLIEMESAHPKWVNIERDVLGNLAQLALDDTKKVAISEWLIDRAHRDIAENNGTYPWAGKFIATFKVIDEMLSAKHKKLNS